MALIEPRELTAHLDDPAWVICDCRFDLGRPTWGEAAYAAGHIPGAVYVHLERDLSGPVGPETGRHPLPDDVTLAERLGALGIDCATQVVAYDQGSSAYAARLWWLLRHLGHDRVAVLNGGIAAWERAGLTVEAVIRARAPRHFRAAPRASDTVSTAELAALVARSGLAAREAVLVDARSAERYAGENEIIDPVAGHVPGAINHPFAGNLDESGHFLEPTRLRERWQQTLRGAEPGSVICMCGSGVTACHDLLALELAGLRGARLYAGSWSEWIRDPARPVARGAR